MSVFHNNALIGSGAATGGAAAAAEYVIPKSLRFNSGDSAYLSKTPSSAGNRRTWTWSGWVKRAKLGDDEAIFSGGASNPITTIRFSGEGSASPDGINIFHYAGSFSFQLTTTAQYRDLSSWYHIVVALDTTQATASNRLKLYVNGEQVTAFDTETYPSQNFETEISNTSTQTIARNGTGSNYKNGYLADIQFVDGQALQASDFAETRSSDGVWVPKEYTFGTNPNNGTTWSSTYSAAFAGNAMTDSATVGSLTGVNSSITITLAESVTVASSLELNLYANVGSFSTYTTVSINGTSQTANMSLVNSTGSNSGVWKVTGFTGTLTSITLGAQGGANNGISRVIVDGFTLLNGARDNSFHLNFSDSSTNEALGFDSAPTTPDPDPKKGMDVITYTGTGSLQNIGGLQFEPGLIWQKPRSNANPHQLFDSVRGDNARLKPSSTDAEYTYSAGVGLTFNPDGFAVGTDNGLNQSGQTFVAWTWRAGGPAVANTDGTITSQVSVSTDYGFSICTYTGGTADASIGHGLGQTPKFYIVKARTSSGYTDSWNVYHTSLGESAYIKLQSNAAATTGSTIWNETAPTSTVFYVDASSNANENNTDYVAYLWSEISGYSKFGTYEGASTVTVTTGFKPRWILLKNVDSSGSWSIFDSERDSDLEINHRIYANENSAEGTNTVIGNFTDTGFTLTNQGNSNWNTTGDTFLYAAFADRPGNNWDVNNIVTNEGLTTSKTQFDVVTYTGNGSTQSIDSLAFQPDLVWLKSRSASQGNILFDSVRGVSNAVFSNNTLAETGQYQKLSSFDSNGFTLTSGTDGSSPNEGNTSSNTYVAWCWKAGGTAVSNTDGSITSSVSAGNGFSIATYTGTGSGTQSVGHGLSSVPALVITKSRGTTGSWRVFTNIGGTYKIGNLNNTDAFTNASVSAPTSSVFNVDGNSNASTTHVAYCFANVPGYQRIGTYYSNSSDPVVVTGFKPRFLLVKKQTAGAWMLLDSQRSLDDDDIRTTVEVNNSNAEETHANKQVKFLDNGFQLIGADMDTSATDWIYLAIGDDEIGSDEDCLVDVPNAVTADADATDTTGGYQRGNYATLNPLHNYNSPTYANGNLEVSNTSTGHWKSAQATIGVTSGKWYWESTMSGASQYYTLGVAIASEVTNNYTGSGDAFVYDGRGFKNGPGVSSVSYGATYTSGDTIGVALDLDAGTLVFYKNGVSQGTAFSTGLTDKTLFPQFSVYYTSAVTQIVNFGQMRFKYPMPTGFSSLNTTALPAATIEDGSAQFDSKLHTGNGSTQTIDSFEFSPDFVWVKQRNTSRDHRLANTVVGTGKDLRANANNAEITDANGITAFNSDGFSVGSSTGWNQSSGTYVAWCWNASANSNKTYTVKVVSDSGNKYRFDDFGTSAVTLDLAEGSTYIFDQSDSSNSGHPIRFGTSANGTDYTTGVTHTGTPGSAGAKTTLVLGTGVSTLYYSCLNHTGMGGQINTNSTAGASNFDGSVQSTVKANPEAGVSIVSYTATGSNLTVGHGLNATPAVIITKDRSAAKDWLVMHESIGVTRFLKLNSTQAQAGPYTNVFTSVSTTTFGTGNDAGINTNGNNRIAYCFSPVAGYSSMGSYTGNGSNDGPFVYTGHKVSWLMIKRTDSTSNWVIVDAARSSFNEVNDLLYAEQGQAETADDGNNGIDFLSNGFKLRKGVGGTNVNGATLVYMAFASNPFQANGGLAR